MQRKRNPGVDLREGFPVEDVTCGKCGATGCLLYPDPGDDTSAPQKHRPSTVCPKCSTPSVESYLRWAAHRKGFRLKEATVFGAHRPAPIMDMQALLDRAPDEESRVATLAELERVWCATEDGSDYTTDFEWDDDAGVLRPRGDHLRPSYALALLFDYGRFMRGESTALDWESTEQEAQAA
jgi:hypothetical protein